MKARHWINSISLFILPALLPAAGVRLQFDPSRIDVGPFPADALTVTDMRQKTGRRMNLPLPNCQVEPSTCAEYSVINQYDGFDPAMRARVRFSGAIQPETLRAGFYFVWLDSLSPREYNLGESATTSPGNEWVYDPSTNTAYARPDQIFDQTRRYAVVVTDQVKDVVGDAVTADPAFTACVEGLATPYCRDLAQAMAIARISGIRGNIVGGSVYTTMSATAFLESARRALARSTVISTTAPAGKTLFETRNLRSVTFRRQVGADTFRSDPLPLPPALLAAAGLGRIAFGRFLSPRFLDPGQVIATTPSAEAVELPGANEIIQFHAWLPSPPAPAGGYPVVIAGHGITDDRFGMPTVLALGLVSQGFAVVAFNAVGHGNGPLSTIQITESDGTATEIPYGGRTTGPGPLVAPNGCVVFAPTAPIGLRDCLRQTVLDTVQLTRLLRSGIDLDGSRRATFDGENISYVGQSMGSFFGAALLAVEPSIKVGVLSVGGDSFVNAARWSISPGIRALMTGYCGGRLPSLLNFEGDCIDNYPLRDEPVRVNNVAGAIAIQNLLETMRWIEAPGSAGNYAPHLRTATLPDVPIKSVLFMQAVGDQVVPGPASTALMRHAHMLDTVSVYRHDLARAAVPGMGANPHTYLTGLVAGNAGDQAVGQAALAQTAGFLLSGGRVVPNVGALLMPVFGRNVFEGAPVVWREELKFQQ